MQVENIAFGILEFWILKDFDTTHLNGTFLLTFCLLLEGIFWRWFWCVFIGVFFGLLAGLGFFLWRGEERNKILKQSSIRFQRLKSKTLLDSSPD